MNRLSVRAVAIVVATGVSIVIAVVTGGRAQTTSPAKRTDPKINEPFKKPDVKGFIQKFESEDREVYAKRAEIVAALGLKPGMSVADVGAGTGLFTRLFADKVGETGRVYAVDICAPFPGAHRRRREETWTVPGRHASGLPVIDQSAARFC